MTIEIHRPELEALIMQRMKNGGFQSVEDALMQALEASPVPVRDSVMHDGTALHAKVVDEALQLPSERSVWDIFAENRKRVPPEEFAKLPTDGADQHDHYLYGHPKTNQ